MADARARLRGLERQRVRGVAVGAGGRGQVAVRGDARWGDEVGGRRGGVDGRGVGEVRQADGDVVAVDEGEVDEVL